MYHIFCSRMEVNMIKNIGFVYDTQKNYNISNPITFSDFCYEDEAEFIKSNLEQCGYNVLVFNGAIEFCNKINSKRKKIDLVFNKCEGFRSRNREGIFPDVLEFFKIPFIGTDAYGLSLSLNKFHTKLIAQHYGVNTPQFALLECSSDYKKALLLSFPIIIKPNAEGSSMGVTLINLQSELTKALVEELALNYGYPLLCEEYIAGNEVSVPIIKTGRRAQALGIVEFQQKNGKEFSIYSTQDKYYDGCKTILFDADSNIKREITNSSLLIYNAIGCRDFGRVDFRIRNGIPYFLEINPLPTLSESGSFELCAHSQNMSFADILDKIIKSALLRYEV